MGRHLLEGRRAVVTAAAGTGIGFAIAERFVDEGATLVVSDRHERRLAETVARLRDQGGEVHGIPCDVTSTNEVDALYAGAEAALGGIDVAVHNAGLGFSSDLVSMRDEDWHRVLDVSLTGSFRCVRAALKRLTSGGAIVNVGSVTGHRAERGQSAYAAAKAGVHALTRCAAMEAAERGVRVNAVMPTLAMHAFLEKAAPAEHLEAMAALQPQGRAAEPAEIANVVVFLASDLASYLTGECVSASGQRA
ncbi:MAG: SDR family oxidoreductase [Myxococcota bacterium]